MHARGGGGVDLCRPCAVDSSASAEGCSASLDAGWWRGRSNLVLGKTMHGLGRGRCGFKRDAMQCMIWYLWEWSHLGAVSVFQDKKPVWMLLLPCGYSDGFKEHVPFPECTIE